MELKSISDLNNLTRRHVAIILAVFVILGFSIRYFPFFDRLMMDDPYYHYTVAKSIVEEGHAPELLELSRYPVGKDIRSSPLLLSLFIARSYRVIQPLGVSLGDYMLVIPVILGSLSIVPLYFLVKQLFDKRTALLSALIYSIIPAAIWRTFAGFVEKESLAAIFIFTWLYLFIRSSKEFNPGDRRTFLLPVLSGLFMGLSALTWGGAAYFALLIATAVFLQTAIKPDRALSHSTVIMTFFGFALMNLFQPLAFPLQDFLLNFRYAGLTYVSLLSVAAIHPERIENVLKTRVKPLHIMGGLIGLFLLFITLFNLQERLSSALAALIQEVSGGKGPVGVAEAERAISYGFGVSDNPFSWLIFFIPVGLYLFLKGQNKIPSFDRIFVLVWFFSGAYSANLQIRLFFNLAPAASMLIAYAFFRLADPIFNQIKIGDSKATLEEASKKERASLSPRSKAGILMALFSLSLIGTVAADLNMAKNTTNSWNETLAKLEEGMVYLRGNTPMDAVVFSWWDYGYMIQGLGERATIVDPGTAGRRRVDSARLLTSTENEALAIINRYNPEERPAYILVSMREVFVIQRAISETANKDLDIRVVVGIRKDEDPNKDKARLLDILSQKRSTIFLRDYSSKDRYDLVYISNLENPDLAENLLPQLLPFYQISADNESVIPFGLGAELEHFQSVWDNGYVFIYKIV